MKVADILRRKKPAEVSGLILSAFREVLGRAPNQRELRQLESSLSRGSTPGSILLEMVRSPEALGLVSTRIVDLGPQDHDAFVEYLYIELLQRPCDESGGAFFGQMLRDGESRTTVVEKLARSDEYINRIVRELYPLPDLRAMAPGRYKNHVATDGSGSVPCYVAQSDADFEWIESKIFQYDYYDRPGIWGASVDDDKRRIASLLADLTPKRVLDVGCATGAVVHCLVELGVDAYGVELSSSAVERALPNARGRIHLADITEFHILEKFDLISGLDIFEHVVPGKVPVIIDALRVLLSPGGLVFANIPAFGEDVVFGTVFESYLRTWTTDLERNIPFELLHVDEYGFPLHGHITWAGTTWWQEQFCARGFVRRFDLERQLQDKYGQSFRDQTPSRSAFYVFQLPELD